MTIEQKLERKINTIIQITGDYPEEMRISPATTVQLERILNYLVKNREYAAQFGNMQITYQGDYKIENNNEEMFIIYRNKDV